MTTSSDLVRRLAHEFVWLGSFVLPCLMRGYYAESYGYRFGDAEIDSMLSVDRNLEAALYGRFRK
jgi:hypothetical protein